MLDDPDWHELSGEDAKMLIMFWLMASEDETLSGYLPDIRKISFRLRKEESEITTCFERLKHWLYHDDIKTISSGYQVDAPETETEKRQRREEKKKPAFKKSESMETELAKMRELMMKSVPEDIGF